jgi:hypothetical protein
MPAERRLRRLARSGPILKGAMRHTQGKIRPPFPGRRPARRAGSDRACVPAVPRVRPPLTILRSSLSKAGSKRSSALLSPLTKSCRSNVTGSFGAMGFPKHSRSLRTLSSSVR